MNVCFYDIMLKVKPTSFGTKWTIKLWLSNTFFSWKCLSPCRSSSTQPQTNSCHTSHWRSLVAHLDNKSIARTYIIQPTLLVHGHATFDIILEEGANKLDVDLRIDNSIHENANTHFEGFNVFYQ
jgi:hypothetical protein